MRQVREGEGRRNKKRGSGYRGCRHVYEIRRTEQKISYGTLDLLVRTVGLVVCRASVKLCAASYI